MNIVSYVIDVHILTTIPIQCLLIKAILETSKFDQFYETCLINILLCELLVCLCEILVKEPASWGLALLYFPSFIQFFSKVTQVVLLGISCQTKLWNFLLAISRFGMLFARKRFPRLMSFKFVSPFILLIWGWSVGLSIYIIGWVDVTFMYKGSNYSIAYATVQPNALLNTYASKCIPGFLFATIFLYLSFFVILYLQNTLSKNAQLKAKVIRSVLAAMLQNFAALISSLPNLYSTLGYENPNWKLGDIDITIYQLTLKIGTNLYATLTAWIVIICLKEYRRPVLAPFISLLNHFGRGKMLNGPLINGNLSSITSIHTNKAGVLMVK